MYILFYRNVFMSFKNEYQAVFSSTYLKEYIFFFPEYYSSDLFKDICFRRKRKIYICLFLFALLFYPRLNTFYRSTKKIIGISETLITVQVSLEFFSYQAANL